MVHEALRGQLQDGSSSLISSIYHIEFWSCISSNLIAFFLKWKLIAQITDIINDNNQLVSISSKALWFHV